MQDNQNIGTRTPAPVGKQGSVCNFNHNENISANNNVSGQTMKPGGTRPIVGGTKPNGAKTGTVTKGVLTREDARGNNRNVC